MLSLSDPDNFENLASLHCLIRSFVAFTLPYLLIGCHDPVIPGNPGYLILNQYFVYLPELYLLCWLGGGFTPSLHTHPDARSLIVNVGWWCFVNLHGFQLYPNQNI